MKTCKTFVKPFEAPQSLIKLFEAPQKYVKQKFCERKSSSLCDKNSKQLMNGKAFKGELRIASKLRINYFRIIINDKQNCKK